MDNNFTFSGHLRTWFRAHGRLLPWRETNDPYVIWLSEIILQQTRVAQGLPYFERFRMAYPNIHAFGSAREEEILKLWQGLGYYTRARNMLATAKIVVEDYHGIFPEDFTKLRSLPGIGPYTAAAIASFAFHHPVAVVDGNVQRVLSRQFGISTPVNSSKGIKEFWEMANQLIDPIHAAEHNQAMMELGAMICTPVNPLCEQCPLQMTCSAYITNTQDNFPVKIKKSPSKNRFFNYLVLNVLNQTLIYQREDEDIWKGLFEFPNFESSKRIENPEEILSLAFTDFLQHKPTIEFLQRTDIKHVLTHQNIYASFWSFSLSAFPALKLKTICVDFDEINTKFALSRLSEKYLLLKTKEAHVGK